VGLVLAWRSLPIENLVQAAHWLMVNMNRERERERERERVKIALGWRCGLVILCTEYNELCQWHVADELAFCIRLRAMLMQLRGVHKTAWKIAGLRARAAECCSCMHLWRNCSAAACGA